MQRAPTPALVAAYIALSSGMLAGCASVASQVEDVSSPLGDGIVYYMPQRPIKVTITFAAATPAIPATPAVPATANSPAIPAKPGTPAKPAVVPPGVPSVDTIDATPDLSRRFILGYEENFVGKNHANIGVDTNGLLTTSNADTTSGIATIVQNIAKAVGTASALEAALALKGTPPTTPPPAPQCQSGRAYSELFYPENTTSGTSGTLCGFSIKVTNLDGGTVNQSPPSTNNTRIPKPGETATQSSQPGVFYKLNLPYLVHVTDPGGKAETQFVAFSPDLAPIAFVPVTRTLFSNNQTQITLSEGTVTAVDATTEGELVALTELPADFISAYAAAVGQLFTAFGNNVQAQTTLINNQQSLAAAKVQQAACSSTIAANQATLSPANLAGVTGAALAAATANINTALSNIQAACK